MKRKRIDEDKQALIHEKLEYINKVKSERISRCQNARCARPVLAGEEKNFEFCYARGRKATGGLFGKRGGVNGLVQSSARTATLQVVHRFLEAELDKCVLLCTTCQTSCERQPACKELA